MGNQRPLTIVEKEQIYRGKLQGRSLAELAAAVGCSIACARKWWRTGRDQGVQGLGLPRRGRGCVGALSHFAAAVANRALAHKRLHPGWGADRVLVELQSDSELQGQTLPSRSRLAAFFKERCPESVAVYHKRPPRLPRAADVTGVHEMWQLDAQEGLALHDGEWATMCTIRDPVGAAIIASQAFVVTSTRRWRKLEWTEVRQVLREAFTEWQTLPDGVQTDNELRLAGSPTDPFPSLLTLWLVGLGIRHRCIRPGQSTDQPHIERNHRTLDGLAVNAEALTNCACFQQALDRERRMYNTVFPCHASDCAGRPPLTAHPELLRPRRFYQPELELTLFDMQRVYEYLAALDLQRKVNATGQVSLGRHLYAVGRRHAGQTLHVRFDASQAQWVFRAETQTEVARRELQGITAHALTGLDQPEPLPTPPIQLTLPCFVA